MAHPGCPREHIAGPLLRRFVFVLGAITLTSAPALSGQSTPASYYTVAPCRVMDTRNPVSSFGGPALAAGATRTFAVGSQCGVSSTAVAISANVTVTAPGAAGHLTVYPAGSPAPLASSINYRAGQTRANNVIVPLGPAGLIVASGQASGATHFIIDINGFFETPTPASTAVEGLKRPDAQSRMDDENAPILIRGGAEYYNPEVVDLIALGPAALNRILVEFTRPTTILDDTPLSLLAYALEKIGDPAAVPVLTDWLEQNVFAELVWAPDFVTHTIKVLDGQGGLNTLTYTYRIDEVLDTIAQARVGQAAAARGLRAAAVSAAANEGTGVCPQLIIVTGINGSGQQETVLLGYKVAARDLDDIINDPTTPEALKNQMTLRRRQWAEADDTAYGSSDYQILPGAAISYKSNCAGKVEENVLNKVAAQRGFATRLGQGGGDATRIRDLAVKFGSQVPVGSLDELTVVSHDSDGGSSFHVEVPVQSNATSAVVHSKDNYGYLRQHTVDKTDTSLAGFAPRATNTAHAAGWGSAASRRGSTGSTRTGY